MCNKREKEREMGERGKEKGDSVSMGIWTVFMCMRRGREWAVCKERLYLYVMERDRGSMKETEGVRETAEPMEWIQ